MEQIRVTVLPRRFWSAFQQQLICDNKEKVKVCVCVAEFPDV